MIRCLALGTAVLAGALLLAPPAAAAPDGSGGVHVEARIDGRAVDGGRLTIQPRRPATIEVTVRNDGDEPVQVRTVRLSGTALELTFFAYDTSVVLDVAPGTTGTSAFQLDLSDLSNQVTGLIPSQVAILDEDRETLDAATVTADVRGSALSVFGVFGVAVLVLTVLSWAAALWALARNRLPANRWRRALRFLPAGAGTGLVAVVTLAVLRLLAPAPAAEVQVVLAAAAIGFGLGYLTPRPDDEDDAARVPADAARAPADAAGAAGGTGTDQLPEESPTPPFGTPAPAFAGSATPPSVAAAPAYDGPAVPAARAPSGGPPRSRYPDPSPSPSPRPSPAPAASAELPPEPPTMPPWDEPSTVPLPGQASTVPPPRDEPPTVPLHGEPPTVPLYGEPPTVPLYGEPPTVPLQPARPEAP